MARCKVGQALAFRIDRGRVAVDAPKLMWSSFPLLYTEVVSETPTTAHSPRCVILVTFASTPVAACISKQPVMCAGANRDDSHLACGPRDWG